MKKIYIVSVTLNLKYSGLENMVLVYTHSREEAEETLQAIEKENEKYKNVILDSIYKIEERII